MVREESEGRDSEEESDKWVRGRKSSRDYTPSPSRSPHHQSSNSPTAPNELTELPPQDQSKVSVVSF